MQKHPPVETDLLSFRQLDSGGICLRADPSKRNRGVFGYVGLLGLLINTILFALNLLGWI